MRRILLTIAALCVLAGAASAQVSPVPFVKPQYFDSNGRPCAGCKLFSYIAGTATPQVTYLDPSGVFPNTNPVILDAAGRANIYLSANGYKLILQTAAGSTIWTVDNVVVSAIALLSSNNTWTGTNTFNGAVTFNSSATFNSGITSSGPNILNGGGTISGTWLGSPTFSGTPNFSGGFLATTGSFSGQITSTLATGTSPFVIASTTVVPNLNVSQLLGCTWAVPCAIGTTTPNSGAFTTLVIGGGTALTSSNQTGTGSIVLALNPVLPGYVDFTEIAAPAAPAAGTTRCYVDSTSHQWACKNTGGVFTIPLVQSVTFCAAGCSATGTPCTTTGASYDQCSNSVPFPINFANTNYSVTCGGVGPVDPGNAPNNGRAYLQVNSKAIGSVSVITVTTGASAIHWTEIDCTAVHP